MKSRWHFPLINPKKKYSLKHYLEHILEEIKEFEEETSEERKRKEVVDILHASETFVRKYFQRVKGTSFEEVKKNTIVKNAKRGYYKH